MSPITLFVNLAILIVMCPLMSFIKGLVMVQGFSAMPLQSPPVATSGTPKEEKASNSATLSPKHEVVCVSLSPIKVEKKRKDRTPSPSSPKIVVDFTSEEEYATFPLTQLSVKEPSIYVLNEKESIVYEREMYRSRAWAALATPAEARVNQDLSSVPSPFAQAAFEEQPKKKGEKGSAGEKGNAMLPL